MEGNKEKTQTIELAINDITVKQQDKSQPINFKFIKNGKNQIFQNNGANIVVTKNNEGNKETTISKQQVVAIQNNDIKIFANIDKFTKAIEEKNVSQTFSLTDTTSSGTNSKEEATLLSLLNTPQITDSKDDIIKSISSTLGDEKKILDPNQDEKVNSSLYVDFYTPELKELENTFIAGNEEAFNNAYTKLEKRIQTVYQIFDIAYNKTSGDPSQKMKELKWDINTLETTITTTYSLPPKYSESLQNIMKAIDNTLNQWYWSDAKHESTSTTASGAIIQK